MTATPRIARTLRTAFTPRTSGAATVLALLLLALGCKVGPIEVPQAQRWREYRNEALGVAFDVPDFLEMRDHGDAAGIVFRYNGANAVLLRFVDESEGLRRGLWHGHPDAGPITLGGHAGKLYRYLHDDGPIWDRTEAYVVPYRGQELGLEFRTHHDAAMRERMLASFRFLAGESAGG